MRERVALVRGQIVVVSRPGGGTRLRATIPALRRPAAEDVIPAES